MASEMMNANRTAAIGAGAFFAAIGFLFAGIGVASHFSDRSEARRLDADGKFASASIIRKYIEANATSGNVKPSFHVQIRFVPEGKSEVYGTAAVNPQAYQRARTGGRIEISYLPNTPSIHRVEGEVRDTLFVVVFAGLGGIFVVIGGGVIHNVLRRPKPRAGARPGLLTRVGIFVTRAPLLLFAGVWLTVGLSFLVAGWFIAMHERDLREQFATEGVSATGTVLSKSIVTETSGSGNSRTQTRRHRLTFRYIVDGDEIVGTANISPGAWERLVERGPVYLTHVVREPWRFRIEGEDGWSSWITDYVLLGVGIFGTAIGGAALAFAYRRLPSWAHTARWPRLSRKTRRMADGGSSVPRVSLPSRMPRLARAARILPQGWFMWVFGSIWLIGGLGTVVSGIGTLIEERRYANGGAVVEGWIAGKSIEEADGTNRQSTVYLLTYRFTTAQGEVHEGQQRLPWKDWEAAKEGDRIAVRYLTGAPRTNREANVDETAAGLVTLGFGPLLGGIGGSIVLLLYYGRKRYERLMRHGVSVAANVIAVEDSGVSVNKVMQKHVRFRFRDAAGRNHEAVSEPMPPEDASDWKPGDIGEIRHDAVNPDDHIWTSQRPAGHTRN